MIYFISLNYLANEPIPCSIESSKFILVIIERKGENMNLLARTKQPIWARIVFKPIILKRVVFPLPFGPISKFRLHKLHE